MFIRTTVLLFVFTLTAAGSLPAQRYLRHIRYGSQPADAANTVRRTSDGGYLLLDSTESYPDEPGTLVSGLRVKTDRNGTAEWLRGQGEGVRTDLLAGHEMPGGGFLLIGNHPQRSSNPLYMARLNRYGFIVWERSFGSDSDTANDGLVEVYAAARTSLPTMTDLR